MIGMVLTLALVQLCAAALLAAGVLLARMLR